MYSHSEVIDFYLQPPVSPKRVSPGDPESLLFPSREEYASEEEPSLSVTALPRKRQEMGRPQEEIREGTADQKHGVCT